MAIARSQLLRSDVEGTYHCVSRCVRRAFLCGADKLTNRVYEHRRQWLKNRLVELAGIFWIDVCGYAVMENHLHVILRNRPDLARVASDEAVARRWWRLFPKRRTATHQAAEPTEPELWSIMAGSDRVDQLRSRLADISWFMRCLKEDIAKRANAEDRVTGRFWEGRFKCTALLDRAAVLACSAYVDLNPIRAGIADRPETSEFTSVQERIISRQVDEHRGISASNDDSTLSSTTQSAGEPWLCPFKDTQTRRGFLDIDLDDYLELVDWTGRQIREGKRGSIPDHLAPILERLDLNGKQWLESSSHFGSMFYRVAGRLEQMAKKAAELGQKWLRGAEASRTYFLA